MLVGGRATYSDWILRSLDEEELRNSEASFYDVIGKYNHTLNENNEIKNQNEKQKNEIENKKENNMLKKSDFLKN